MALPWGEELFFFFLFFCHFQMHAAVALMGLLSYSLLIQLLLLSLFSYHGAILALFFSHYYSSPTVRDWVAVYLAFFIAVLCDCMANGSNTYPPPPLYAPVDLAIKKAYLIQLDGIFPLVMDVIYVTVK